MGYLPYFLALWAFQYVAGYAFSYPLLIVAAAAVLLARRMRWLPDPYLWLKHARRVGRLKAEISQNPDNVTSRRDLARIWLEKGRPRRAITVLEEARRREPDSPELAFLLGKAHLMAGKAEKSLEFLVESAHKNEKFHYGEAYLLAGRALLELRRAPEAEDALDRYLAINTSSVEGHVLLALARREQKDKAGADKAMREALDTFAHVPRFRRRAELRWWLRANLMRVGLG
jgi:predicted Zn-dependent protease